MRCEALTQSLVLFVFILTVKVSARVSLCCLFKTLVIGHCRAYRQKREEMAVTACIYFFLKDCFRKLHQCCIISLMLEP